MDDQSLPITVQIIVNRPVENVWKTWTTAADIMKWNVPFDNWHSPLVENDLKPGGDFLYRMEAKDGSEGFDHCGKYDKIIINQLIEYTLSDGRRSIIKFIPGAGTTTVVETFEPERTNSLEMQKNFCQSVLTKFKNYAEMNNDLV